MAALRALMAVLAVVFAGSASLFVLLGVRRGRELSRRRGWRRTDGVILAFELEPGANDSARPRVRYRFELDGPREGEGLEEALDAFLPRARAEALRRRFVVGTAVPVRADAADPSRSVLESGMAPRPALLWLAAAVFVALSGAFWAGVALLG